MIPLASRFRARRATGTVARRAQNEEGVGR